MPIYGLNHAHIDRSRIFFNRIISKIYHGATKLKYMNFKPQDGKTLKSDNKVYVTRFILRILCHKSVHALHNLTEHDRN